MLCRATVTRSTRSDPHALFCAGTWDYEDLHPFEGIAMMEVPSIVPNKERHVESMYFLEVDRDGGTALVLQKVTKGVYCRAERYSAMRRRRATHHLSAISPIPDQHCSKHMGIKRE
ncbi:uncharacterized protein B0T23DRAFT_33363 [Neurospora hispaniola]|uniref:Uncharacterized protein n=1 Tax=Neurospora hispaniola TaxID=588809 RepID=A0AAJ0IGN5_9PEZI|nr:hypothetical protein B0T23DRAFT_33363 [Neurospora hispaniola]